MTPGSSSVPSTFLDEPVARTLWRFALPVIGTSALQSLNGSINAVWAGRLLGETGLAATSTANLIMFLVMALIFGLATASTIMVGHSMGRQDLDGARQAIGAGAGIFLLVGIAVSCLGWVLSPHLLAAVHTPSEIFPSALIYLRAMFVGLTPTLFSVFLAMSMRSVGDSATPLIAIAAGTLLDGLLNPVMILGLGPAPRLGILGAGVATAVANLLTMAVLLAIIYRRDLPIRLRGTELCYLRPSLPLAAKILRMGIPMSLQAVAMAGSTLVIIDLINREGAMTVAAYGVINQAWTYIQMPGMAVGMAVSAMAAQNIGAGRWDRVRRISHAGLGINLVLTGTLVLLSLAVGDQMLRIFLSDGAGIITTAVHINSIAGWAFVFQALAMVLASVTRANGATIVPLLIMLVAFVPVRLGVAHGLRPTLGVDAIWWSLTLGGAALFLLTVLYYASGHWRKPRPDHGPFPLRRGRDHGGPERARTSTTYTSPFPAAPRAEKQWILEISTISAQLITRKVKLIANLSYG